MKKDIFFKAVIFVFLVFIDQLSKYLIRSQGGFYICNKGIAFGIKLPGEDRVLLLIMLILFFGLLILNFKFEILTETKIKKLKNLNLIENFKLKIENFNQKDFIRNALCIIFILSGAVANIIDRLYFGCVIDFIDLKIWPVFNLADAFITIGALMLAASLFRKQNAKS